MTPSTWWHGSPWCTASAWWHGERDRSDRHCRKGERAMARGMTPPAPKADSADVVTSPRLTSEELRKINAYWRACTYLAAGMIYLRTNPLLREPLKPEHIKKRLLGHWGTSPGLSFMYIHLNRL